ncbi:hypothetical protein Hanom_Chr04g00342041 [Helianthus anomalus]
MEAAKIVAQTEESLSGYKSGYDAKEHHSSPHYPRDYSRDYSRHEKRKRYSDWSSRSSEDRSRRWEDARAASEKARYTKSDKEDYQEKKWTQLTKTPLEVLNTEKLDLKDPLPMRSKKGQDPSLFCEFHKDTGHLTNDCIQLRIEIEKALKSGKLEHLLKSVRKDIKKIQRNG